MLPQHELVDTIDFATEGDIKRPGQPGFRIDIVHLGRLYEEIDIGGSFAVTAEAHEKAVLAAMGYRRD